MNQKSNKSLAVSRKQKSELRVVSSVVQKTQVVNKKEIGLTKSSLSIITSSHQKCSKLALARGFYKLAVYKNKNISKEITVRYLVNTLKRKMNSDNISVLSRMKGASYRFKTIKKFSNYLSYLQKSKQAQFKQSSLMKLKVHKLIKSNQDFRANKSQNKESVKMVNTITDSRVSSTSRRNPPINRSGKQLNKSTTSLRGKAIKTQSLEIDIPEDVDALKRQYEQFKLLQLSEQARNALMKAQRFDRFIYSRQTQKICKQPLKNQIVRLQKIKNVTKSMRGRYFDNELTVTALYNHIKLISQMNREIGDLNNFKNQLQKEEQRKKKEEFEAALQAKKKSRSNSHANNVENQMKKIMNDIDENLKTRQLKKAKILIQTFLKKYEKEDFAQERVHFYHALNESIENYDETEKCMDEITKILQTLSVADLNEVDVVLRSLKANHKDFNYLTNKYRNSEKFHGKQMTNIIHNLLKFNDDIIKYLQQKKLLQNEIHKNKQKNPLVDKYEEQIKKMKIQSEKHTKSIHLLEIQLQKSKKHIEKLESQKNSSKSHNKFEIEFDKKISVIIDKMNKKVDISRDLENLLNNQTLKSEKPFSHFIIFQKGLEHIHSERIIHEVNQIEKLLLNIGNIFHKPKMTHEKRFSEVAKILQISGKKDPHLYDLHKTLESLMVTIVGKTDESVNEKDGWKLEKQKLQKSLSTEKLKSEKLGKEIQGLRTSRVQSHSSSRGNLKGSVVKKTQQTDKQVTNLKSEVEKYKQKITILQTEIREYHEKVHIYELYEKKITVIIQKIQNGGSWKRQFESLGKDEKFMNLKIYEILSVMRQDGEQKQQQKIDKSAEKLENIINSVSVIFEKKITVEKKIGQITKVFQKIYKTDPGLKSIFTVIEEWMKNSISPPSQDEPVKKQKSVEKSKNYEQTIKKLTQEKKKLADENKKINEEKKKVLEQSKKPSEESKKWGEQKKKLSQQVKKLSEEIKKLTEENKKINDEKRKLLEQSKKPSEQSKKLIEQKKKVSQENKRLSEEIKKLTEENKKINEEKRKVLQQSKKPSEQSKKWGEQKKKLSQEIKKLSEEMKKLTEENKKPSQENKKLIEQKKKMNQSLGEEKKKIGQLNAKIRELQKKEKESLRKISELEKKEKSPQKQDPKLRNQLNELREEMKQNLQFQKSKERIVSQTTQYISNITKNIETMKYEKIERDIVTLIKVYEKEQINSELIELLNGLIILVNITKQQQEEKKKEAAEKKFARTPQKKKTQSNLSRTIKRTQSEIKKNKFTTDPQFWNQFKVSDDENSQQVQAYLKVMNTWSTQVTNKNKKIEQLTDELQKQKLSKRNLLSVMKTISTTLMRKEFFQSDECWQAIIQQFNSHEQQFNDLFKIVKKLSGLARDKIVQERKQNEKAIKSYENDLMHLNNLVSSLEIKIGEKDRQYQQLCNSISSAKINTEQRRSSSLSRSRKSFKSTNSEKERQAQITNLKNSIQAFTLEQKNMLQKIDEVQNEKQNLLNLVEEQQLLIKKYMNEIELFEQEKLTLKLGLTQQFEYKENGLIQQINQVSKERQESIKKFQLDFTSIQSELERQISHLKGQIVQQSQSVSVSDYQNIKIRLQNAQNQINRLNSLRDSGIKIIEERQVHQFQESQIRIQLQQTVTELSTVKSQQNQMIENEINMALRNQEQDFNRFLQQQNQQRQQYYETVVIPSRIQEHMSKVNVNSTINVNSNITIDYEEELKNKQQQIRQRQMEYENLKKSHNDLALKFDQQVTIIETHLTTINNLKTQFNFISQNYENLKKSHKELALKSDQQVTTIETHLTTINKLKTQFNFISQNYENLKKSHNELALKSDQQVTIIETHLTTINKLKTQFNVISQNYEKQINNSNNKGGSASKANIDYEQKYRTLQLRSSNQISDLKSKLQLLTKSQQSEVKLLKEVIHNQKIQLNQLQLMIRSIKQGKEEAQKEKETYFMEIQNIIKQKSQEMHIFRQQYEVKINRLVEQKYGLQHRIRENQRTQVNVNHTRIFQMETQLTNKNMQIRQLEQFNEKRKMEMEDERRKSYSLQRQIQNIKLSHTNLQSHIYRLQSDISNLTNENNKFKEVIRQYEGKQSHLRTEYIKVKTQSDMENAQTLKEQIKNLKRQITSINTKNVHTQDNIKIKRLLKDIEFQRNSDKFQYDEAQLQILRRIEIQVSQLVETNRQLQTKLIIMEGYVQGNDPLLHTVNFYTLLQHRMEELINFVLEKDLISTSDEYNRFIFSSRKSLQNCDYEEYFSEWSNLMKILFSSVNEKQSEQLRKKADQMIQLKEQMTQILDKQIEYSEDENFQTLQKYKMIFTDIKFLLKEFLKGGDSQYLNMICRSLGFESNEY